MKVSLNWLKSFIDLEGYTPEEIASKLTFAGVEVDSVSKLASATNLVIGEILTCVAHPDSDPFTSSTLMKERNTASIRSSAAPQTRESALRSSSPGKGPSFLAEPSRKASSVASNPMACAAA